MTGHGDIPMSVRAMKAGAIDFLAKPFRDQDMLDAVSRRDRVRHASAAATRKRCATIRSLFAIADARASGKCWRM